MCRISKLALQAAPTNRHLAFYSQGTHRLSAPAHLDAAINIRIRSIAPVDVSGEWHGLLAGRNSVMVQSKSLLFLDVYRALLS